MKRNEVIFLMLVFLFFGCEDDGVFDSEISPYHVSTEGSVTTKSQLSDPSIPVLGVLNNMANLTEDDVVEKHVVADAGFSILNHVQGYVEYDNYSLISHGGIERGFLFAGKTNEETVPMEPIFPSSWEDYAHPGGMQVMENVLVTGLTGENGGLSRISLLKLPDPALQAANFADSICELGYLELEGDVPNAAIVKIPNTDYHLISSCSSGMLECFVIDDLETRVADAVSTDSARQIQPLYRFFSDNVSSGIYQSISLVTDDSGDIYLLGLGGETDTLRNDQLGILEELPGTDHIEAYKLTIYNNWDGVDLEKEDQNFYAARVASEEEHFNPSFRWGGSLEIKNNRVIVHRVARNFTTSVHGLASLIPDLICEIASQDNHPIRLQSLSIDIP